MTLGYSKEKINKRIKLSTPLSKIIILQIKGHRSNKPPPTSIYVGRYFKNFKKQFMPNEEIKTRKATPSERIMSVLDRLPIGEAIEEYNKAGTKLHDRIEASEKELAQQKNKLPKKETE